MVLIHVIYYVYLHPPSHYLETIQGQLYDLKTSGLLQVCSLHVILCGDASLCQQVKQWLSSSIYISAKSLEILETTENTYEYPGFHKLYELGSSDPESIILYFHTKGISYENRYFRHPLNIALTRQTIDPWREVIQIFATSPQIQKVALFPSQSGPMLFNFFWLRGAHVKTCPPPTPSGNRYTYEEWLGWSSQRQPGDTYNLYTHDHQLITHAMAMIGARHMTVEKVSYGTTDRHIDMTQRFINCWSEQTPIRVDNHLAGTDPVPGASKKLTITFSDFQTLEFPEESMIDSSLLLKIPFKQISRIEYGHVDVMTSFMNQWAHTNDFLITNKSMGLDPLPGQIKNLQIILTDGRQLQLVEGQIFHPLVLLKLLQAP